LDNFDACPLYGRVFFICQTDFRERLKKEEGAGSC
jgi:hypothetical protein